MGDGSWEMEVGPKSGVCFFIFYLLSAISRFQTQGAGELPTPIFQLPSPNSHLHPGYNRNHFYFAMLPVPLEEAHELVLSAPGSTGAFYPKCGTDP